MATPGQRRVSAVVVALIVATVLTGIWLRVTVPNEPPCASALCWLVEGLPWAAALIGWPVVFLATTRQVATTGQGRVPAVVVALIVATVLTGIWLLVTVPNQPPCHGALCGLVEGWPWGAALIGWPVIFLATWFIAWKLRREVPGVDES